MHTAYYIVLVVGAHEQSACVWGIVPTLQSDGSPSWTDTALNLDTSAPGEVYVAALYWSVMTLTTIGYGDVITTGVGERVLAIFLMFLGTWNGCPHKQPAPPSPFSKRCRSYLIVLINILVSKRKACCPPSPCLCLAP